MAILLENLENTLICALCVIIMAWELQYILFCCDILPIVAPTVRKWQY